MTLSFILPSYPWQPMGGFRVVYQYATLLAARGHAVHVFHLRDCPGVKKSSTSSAFGPIKRFARFFRERGPKPRINWQSLDPRVRLYFGPISILNAVPDGDAVFATGWQTVDSVLGLPSEKGLKCYLVQHYETWCGPEELVDATWRSSLKKFVISKWLVEKSAELGVSASDVVHIPNGVDHSLFRVLQPISDRRPAVSMMYSQQSFKRPEDGVAALCEIKERFSRCEAHVFGVGERPSSLPSWVRYDRSPAQSKLVDIYNRSSIFISSSEVEGWSLPPAEAMACGCAVVCTDSRGVRDYTVHGWNGLISPPGQPDMLALNAMSLLTDANRRIAIAEAGRAHIQEFTWPRSTDLMEVALRHWIGKSLGAARKATSTTSCPN